MEKDTFQKFGYSFQIKIISLMMKEASFLQQIRDILEIEYFESSSNQWIIKNILDYFEKYKSVPNLETFKALITDIESDNLKNSVVENLKDVYRNFESSDLAFVKEKVLEFCKNKCIKNAILDSVNMLEEGDYDSIKRLIDDAMKAGMERRLGHEYTTQIEERYKNSVRNTVETPWEIVNNLTDGGLGKGELGVFVAPAGIGKSWALINIGSYAIRAGLNVIHYTLELSEEYVGLRYDSVLTGIPAQNLKNHIEEVKEKVSKITGNLTIKYYPTKGAKIVSLQSHIDKSIALGTKPDLIILDYADLIKASHQRDKRHELESIYEDLRGLAGEYKIPIWTASQANRSSLAEDVQYIDASQIAESYSKVMIADFVMSLSRKVEDKIAGTGIWHVIKNRFGPDGLTFPSQINASNGQIYIHDRDSFEGKRTMKKIDNRAEYSRLMLAQKFKEFSS